MKSLTALVVMLAPVPFGAAAAPSAEVAKLCQHNAYVAYPWKRPGAVRMSGDRLAYFQDCVAKGGTVPKPDATKPDATKPDATKP